MFLLDTNIISELRKPKPHGVVLAWFQDVPASLLFICALTVGELQSGIEKTREQNPAKASEIESWLENLSESVHILPMDVECFREYARLIHGKSHDLVEDAVIAATARVHRLTVVTRNIKDFRYFPVETFNPFQYRPEQG